MPELRIAIEESRRVREERRDETDAERDALDCELVVDVDIVMIVEGKVPVSMSEGLQGLVTGRFGVEVEVDC